MSQEGKIRTSQRAQLWMRWSASWMAIPGYSTLVLATTMIGFATALTNPFLPLFAITAVGMTPLSLGIFLSATALSGIVVSTILGRASDAHADRRWILLFATLAAVCGYTLFAVIRHYGALLLISVLFITVASAAIPQLFAYARQSAARAHSRSAPFAISILRTFFSVAWVIGPAIGALLLQRVGFTGLFLAVAGSYGLAALLIFLFLRPCRSVRDPQSPPVGIHALLRRDIGASTGAFVALQAANTGGVINLPLFLTHTLARPASDVGVIFGTSAALEIPFMLAFGMATIKLDKLVLIRLGTLLGAAYFIVVGSVSATWQIIVAQGLNAAFVAVSMGIGISYFQDFLPGQPGAATTLYTNTTRVGSITAGLIVGSVAELWGYRSVFFACATLTALAFCLLLWGEPQAIP